MNRFIIADISGNPNIKIIATVYGEENIKKFLDYYSEHEKVMFANDFIVIPFASILNYQ